MTWLSTDQAERINSFADAQFHYENCAPIRSSSYNGKEVDGVPLMRHRRDWRHKSLHKVSDDTYAFRLYDTNVVEINRDGSIKLDISYGSSTTDAWAAHWIYELTGRLFSVHSEKNALGVSWSGVSDEQVQQYRTCVPRSKWSDWAFFYTDLNQFRIEPEGDDRFYIHDTAPRFVKHVDKSAAFQSRKRLQPVLQYLKIFSMNPMPEDGYREMQKKFTDEHGWVYSAYKKVVENPDDATLYPFVAAEFHRTEYKYNHSNRSYDYTTALVPMNQIKKTIYDYLYEFDDINNFQQLALGEDRAVRLYTKSEVNNFKENHNG